MYSIVARQLREYKFYLLVFVSKAWPRFVTHNIFYELLLAPLHVHEILVFDISVWITHFCPGEISKISFLRLWGLNWWHWLCQFRRFLEYVASAVWFVFGFVFIIIHNHLFVLFLLFLRIQHISMVRCTCYAHDPAHMSVLLFCLYVYYSNSCVL